MNEIEKFETKCKTEIFNRIKKICDRHFDIIATTTGKVAKFGQPDASIPNTGITLNNKIIELANEFKRAGISLFSYPNEDLGFIDSSFIGDAIIGDLLDKLTESTEKLDAYSQTIEDLYRQKNERLSALQNISPLKKFFARIRAFFMQAQSVDVSLSDEEQASLESTLQAYTNLDSEIFNYNLRDNLVHALVKNIAGPVEHDNFKFPHRREAPVVPGLLEDYVVPDLKKLGLEYLIPGLQEALTEEYRKSLPDSNICPLSPEEIYWYIPDFSRLSNQTPVPKDEDLPRMHGKAAQDINQRKALREGLTTSRGYVEGTIGLKDFAAVSAGVPEGQRNGAIIALKEQLVQDNSHQKAGYDPGEQR